MLTAPDWAAGRLVFEIRFHLSAADQVLLPPSPSLVSFLIVGLPPVERSNVQLLSFCLYANVSRLTATGIQS